MIPVQLADEPPEFHGDVRIPGLRSIYEKCGLPVPEEYRRKAGPCCERVSRRHIGTDRQSHFPQSSCLMTLVAGSQYQCLAWPAASNAQTCC